MSEYYLIHTKTNGTIAAELNLETPNATVVGQSNTFTFWLPNNFGDKTFSSDTTIEASDVEEYDSITIPSGVTVTVYGILQANDATIDGDLVVEDNGQAIFFEGNARSNLLAYREWANKYQTQKMLDGRVKYREQVDDSDFVDSLVVKVEPANDLHTQNVNGVWGIIDEVTDERGPVLDTNRITISVTILSELDNYANHTEIENELLL